MSTKIAVITGGNKGIGYAIVRGLLKKFDGKVFLTSRNESLGKESVESLKSELGGDKCKSLEYHQLDITDDKSAKTLRDHIKQKYGGIDILINNAGIAYKQASTAPFAEQAEMSMLTNYGGTKIVCDALFPILRDNARVVMVSSSAAFLKQVSNAELRDKFLSPELTIQKLDELTQMFVSATKAGNHQSLGFSNSAYGMSKVAMNALTFVYHRQLANDPRNIIINTCHPGYVDTDMSSHKGPLTIDEGAETPLYLALLPLETKQPNGKFLKEKKVCAWFDGAFE